MKLRLPLNPQLIPEDHAPDQHNWYADEQIDAEWDCQ